MGEYSKLAKKRGETLIRLSGRGDPLGIMQEILIRPYEQAL